MGKRRSASEGSHNLRLDEVTACGKEDNAAWCRDSSDRAVDRCGEWEATGLDRRIGQRAAWLER
jgi:hypothetical protein